MILILFSLQNSVGSEKPSYEVKEIADWAKDDEDENNEKESTDDKQEEKSVAEQTSAPRNTHDDKFNRGKVSDSSKPSTSDSSSKTHSKPDNLTAKKSDDNKSSSVNKISNILKSFEKKEEVDYEKPKKKFEFSVEAGRTRSKWQEREKKESVDTPPVKLSDRPRAKSHPAKVTKKFVHYEHPPQIFSLSLSRGIYFHHKPIKNLTCKQLHSHANFCNNCM